MQLLNMQWGPFFSALHCWYPLMYFKSYSSQFLMELSQRWVYCRLSFRSDRCIIYPKQGKQINTLIIRAWLSPYIMFTLALSITTPSQILAEPRLSLSLLWLLRNSNSYFPGGYVNIPVSEKAWLENSKGLGFENVCTWETERGYTSSLETS